MAFKHESRLLNRRIGLIRYPGESDGLTRSLRRRIEIEGASTSWLKTLESMQRIHLIPRFGDTPIDKLTTADVETMSGALLRRGLKPKTVRMVISCSARSASTPSNAAGLA
jgi:hypothetical protein